MRNSWEYRNPVHLHFGRGCRQLLVDKLVDKRCLVVTTKRGRGHFLADKIFSSLPDRLSIEWMDSVTFNPSIANLQASIDSLLGSEFDAIIAFGGGSAIDSAKALSVALSPDTKCSRLVDLLANPELHKSTRPCPVYAVPTTAGTGSEATPYSTVWDDENRKKHSLAGPAVFPYAAIVDPALTDELPWEITLATGLDAIDQALESVWNHNATTVTLGLAAQALRLALRALPRLNIGAIEQTDRDDMAEGSLLSGLAISQTRTALCHSISYPLTSHFGVPHGLACAFTMLDVFNLNRPFDDGRFKELAQRIGCKGVSDLEEKLTALIHELGVAQRVRSFIPSLEALKELSSDMYTPGRADNNLAPVDEEEIGRILECAYNRE